MPSTTRSRQPKQSSQTRLSSVTQDHIAFVPLLLLVFVMWVAYRVLFHFPVWFDETLGKAVFFGLPVWLYLVMSRSKSMAETMSPRALKPGLLLGLAFGGIFGFAGTLISLLKKGVIVQSAPLFTSDIFWWEFFFAMMTGFWESLFFMSL